MRSDIFDEYAKIAEEIGLVSSAEEDTESQYDSPKESSKLKKYKKSPHPRMGSDDISTIEALYGIKSDTIPKYEFNIMEAAHPKPVVIGPAYDRINALVENNIERNNIMCNIARKPSDSISNQTRYAHKELLMELIRLANDMDNTNNEEIRKLADVCIDGLNNEKKKFNVEAGVLDWLKEQGGDIWETARGASTGALVGAIVGAFLGQPIIGIELGSAAGGLIAAIARTTPQVRGIAYNANDTKSQIDDIKTKIPEGPQHKFLDDFTKELTTLANIATKYNEIVSTMKEDNKDTNDSMVQDAHSITNLLIGSMDKVIQYCNQFNSNAKNKVYEEYTGHSKLLTPIYRFISDDVEDVVDSIKSLSLAINNLKAGMKSIGQEAKTSVEQAKTESTTSTQKSNKEITTNNKNDEDEEFVGEDGEDDSNTNKKQDNGGFFNNFTKGLGIKPNKREEEWFKSLMGE